MNEPALANATAQDVSAVYGMPAHEDRAAAVGEVHARPNLHIAAPRTVLQFAFMTEGDLSRDSAAMNSLSDRLGAALQARTSPLHSLTWNEGDLHCEKHTEFSTYLWCTSLDSVTITPRGEDPFKHGFTPPGPVVCGIRLDVLPWTIDTEKVVRLFDPISLCFSEVEEGAAAIVTDFRQDEDGLTYILILDRGLTQQSAGVLAQRLIEIENYRTLALLALPLTQSLASDLRRTESRLAEITEMMRSRTWRNSEVLLSELTDLAAELEASTVTSLYRFGASRAYFNIVEERLAALSEEAVTGYYTWQDFLLRRITPAMRTCRTVKERQAKLSDKLTRSIALLRSWIDVEIERQNRDLLASMNNRARLQLRLQQTVEGLSVAAVSYYVVSLLSYLLKGFPGIGEIVAPELAVTALVPAIVLAIWWAARRIRHSHSDTKQ
ncbi:DUF3422 family protein [Burkholderia cepacia]|uniref:DUF3422 family protein n=1 Tax=Burkholderia cepacia TaxID=292 RepID=UPI001CF14982|nr:DUF3422 family protein [Burkholderia cepacia]MCA8348430.1 DUF3422 family protein [Burkholderia cepacia]